MLKVGSCVGVTVGSKVGVTVGSEVGVAVVGNLVGEVGAGVDPLAGEVGAGVDPLVGEVGAGVDPLVGDVGAGVGDEVNPRLGLSTRAPGSIFESPVLIGMLKIHSSISNPVFGYSMKDLRETLPPLKQRPSSTQSVGGHGVPKASITSPFGNVPSLIT